MYQPPPQPQQQQQQQQYAQELASQLYQQQAAQQQQAAAAQQAAAQPLPASKGPTPLEIETLKRFWQEQMVEVGECSKDPGDYKNSALPLARIKKIMKSDEDVRMIAAEAPVLFAKACEMFILELTLRGWCHAEDSKRRTLQRSDIAAVVSRVEILDFLQDVVPPEEAAAGGGVKSEDGAHPGGSGGGGGVVGPSTSAAAAVHGPHAAHLAGASGAHFLPPGLNGLPFAPPGLPFAPGAGTDSLIMQPGLPMGDASAALVYQSPMLGLPGAAPWPHGSLELGGGMPTSPSADVKPDAP